MAGPVPADQGLGPDHVAGPHLDDGLVVDDQLVGVDGPMERLLGLATLEVSSAGPDISIPGLSEADASRIKHLVTERAGVVDEDDAGLGSVG